MNVKKNAFCESILWLAMVFASFLTGCGPNESQPVKTIINTVTNFTPVYITNTIVSYVTNEVPVPAQIPEDYVTARNLVQKMTNATLVSYAESLFEMKDISVSYDIDDSIKTVVTEDEVKARFELTLRKNGVPINASSQNSVNVTIGGFFENGMNAMLCYSINYDVINRQFVFRNGICHTENVVVWTKDGKYGTVGKYQANEALLNEIEKGAEIFANDFLTANPK